MKKTILVMLSLLILAIVPVQAQFGKLLGSGKSSVGKKSGSFATVWESEFENKATILAVCGGTGDLIIGTDDNSASVIDGSGKAVWNGDYKN